ncbi:hypothetical protein [Acidovorax sp. NCPPB 3576]|uniref:hypothetical protein n=1 Tax=Acidovorax sp. NCPPB 3576 TaxID=2940488 RepID=UPI002348FDD1|nr:hypothetical protein [Acidovorax sp. NCPPB 3576]WCM88832.1 hypothetical protein M5C98_01905 [Acidovorax sp. NCPPB 3576]
MDAKVILDWGTLAIATYAAAIGTFNFMHERRRDQARIKVEPSIARLHLGGYRLSLNVTNLSAFEVSIAEMGFIYGRGTTHGVFHPSRVSGHHLPIRLGPRANVHLFVPASAHEDSRRNLIEFIYVKTADGVIAKSSNAALEAFAQDAPTAATDSALAEALQEWGTIITSPHGYPKGQLPGEDHDSPK